MRAAASELLPPPGSSQGEEEERPKSLAEERKGLKNKEGPETEGRRASPVFPEDCRASVPANRHKRAAATAHSGEKQPDKREAIVPEEDRR